MWQKIIHLFPFGVNVKVGHFSLVPPPSSYFHQKIFRYFILFNSIKLPVMNPNQCVLSLSRSLAPCCRDVQKKLSYWLQTNPLFSRCSPCPYFIPPFWGVPLSARRGTSTSGFRSIIGRRPNSHVECCRQRVLLSSVYHRALLSMLSILCWNKMATGHVLPRDAKKIYKCIW